MLDAFHKAMGAGLCKRGWISGDGDARSTDEADSLSLTCLLVLERLRPVERSVFLLHDVYGHGLPETAGVVGLGESTCRQLLLRARRAMKVAKDRIEAERREADNVAARFVSAVRDGDVERVLGLLAPDAIACLGSEVDTREEPEVGREAVAARLGLLRQQVHCAGRSLDVDQIVSIKIAGGLVQTVRTERARGSTPRPT